VNRVGTGFDLHRLVTGRPLVLGGVKIDHHLGLEGHSDADVLLHALADALLGAAALGDLGHHFPPGDDRYRGISSLIMLGEVQNKLEQKGWRVANADMVIIAEEPKLAPYIDQMCEIIAGRLKVPRCRISVKATTTEGLGVCGRCEAIAAQAVVLLETGARSHPTGQEAV
jgi:2-C-methyl-D-erythritol 2,4-cyclodiphosphate synthase